MNVGIYLRNSAPESGGASVFENDVFQALVSSAQFSHHSFTVFSTIKIKNGYSLPHNLRFSPLIARRNPLQMVVNKGLATFAKFLKLQREPFTFFKNSIWLDKILQQENIDLIWFPAPIQLVTDTPFIMTIWDLEHRKQPYFPEVSHKGLWEKREQFYSVALSKAFAVLTGTETGKKEIETYYQVNTDNIKVVPFSTPKFALEASNTVDRSILSKYGLLEDYLLYPAQFWPHKNHIRAVEALKILSEKYCIKQSLVFVGENKGNYHYIKQVVETLGLSKQVFFLGFVPQEDLVALYQNAFALTYLSFFGPDNLPPLEAFALGCPVIAANIPGAKDQLGEHALFFNPLSAEDLAEKIKLLHDDKVLYSNLILQGKKMAMENTGRDYIKKIFLILDELEKVRKCWGTKSLN
jgi:glycosyltransferase involved in cell wall biosynthesis